MSIPTQLAIGFFLITTMLAVFGAFVSGMQWRWPGLHGPGEGIFVAIGILAGAVFWTSIAVYFITQSAKFQPSENVQTGSSSQHWDPPGDGGGGDLSTETVIRKSPY